MNLVIEFLTKILDRIDVHIAVNFCGGHPVEYGPYQDEVGDFPEYVDRGERDH